jgi:hypothetical protein
MTPHTSPRNATPQETLRALLTLGVELIFPGSSLSEPAKRSGGENVILSPHR